MTDLLDLTVEQILAFERRHPSPGAAKDAAIWDELQKSPTAYFLAVNRMLDNYPVPALEADPGTYNRLLRARLQRRERWTT